MDWLHKVRRAFDLDMEEIKLFAEAAREAPVPVAHQMLGMIGSEMREASLWDGILAACDGMHAFPPPSPPPYPPRPPFADPPYTVSEKPATTKEAEKEEQ
ncbi:hypothetical protein [Moorella sp. Hama-1]|uniref:hypothetical protein n=1 Tax=Moorella sp. Hama-1 TaxID=2138101 RepID=UPI000D6461CB|nr:hypothetical protein [Moorella sp. Hama-1]MDN5362180.1 hypothetical protein [Moorella sp. (in: firmicutes)]BCV21371.1 hypothetical protein hamaS1_14400 [Moorella sp. Hama-1]